MSGKPKSPSKDTTSTDTTATSKAKAPVGMRPSNMSRTPDYARFVEQLHSLKLEAIEKAVRGHCECSVCRAAKS